MASSLAGVGSPIVFASVLQVAREAGMDVSAFGGVYGADAWTRRLPIWERVMRTLRIDGFPIRVARRYAPVEIGPLGMAANVAPDLGSAFDRLLRHQHLLSGTAIARAPMDREPGARRFEIDPVEGDGLAARCRREMMVASGLKFARDVTGVPITPRRVCFAHAAPRDRSEHDAFFGTEVCFGADYDGLELDLDTLALPLPRADADLAQFLDAHLRASAGDPPAGFDLVASVRRVIRRELGTQTLTMDRLASEFGMSARTLRRHLQERGTSYHAILDDERREVADDLLANSRHTISEVAFLLDFSEASAFHRAYVRWTGTTPGSRGRVRPG